MAVAIPALSPRWTASSRGICARAGAAPAASTHSATNDPRTHVRRIILAPPRCNELEGQRLEQLFHLAGAVGKAGHLHTSLVEHRQEEVRHRRRLLIADM